ncbi:RibD family protein [Mesorhizobium sp. BR1-1-16]|uniref:dihydrofolate reductase family protein n=1 Tax=Mesorhizobium sp. BR1-1-16 TaxID=2876653 RepID=UPI001CCF5983|nr:RibD family protein [Mesorhizobium sp. BR1-1-16]MBZ9936918.1 RibD family protein [Mesorhizobium sp. BR1-1-16]
MRPRVILHMMSSIDGRITPEGWPASADRDEVYEAVHRALAADAWLVGRHTMAEFAQGAPRPISADGPYPRQTCKASAAGMGPYAVCLDPSGRLHLNRDRVNGDAVVAILSDAVPDDHLAELRRDGISYLFAGAPELDLVFAIRALRAEFGVETLLLEGGGATNGAFLGADLVDEISLLVLPIADGKTGTPTTFDGNRLGASRLALISATPLAVDIVHLRYHLLPRGDPGTTVGDSRRRHWR